MLDDKGVDVPEGVVIGVNGDAKGFTKDFFRWNVCRYFGSNCDYNKKNYIFANHTKLVGIPPTTSSKVILKYV